jgi:hypothetical protein
MQDNEHGLRNRAPMKEDQRVVLLSPQNESYAGPQYDHNPVTAGGVPEDPLGYFPEGTTVPDSEFYGWPAQGPQTVANYALTEFEGSYKNAGDLVPEGPSSMSQRREAKINFKGASRKLKAPFAREGVR